MTDDEILAELIGLRRKVAKREGQKRYHERHVAWAHRRLGGKCARFDSDCGWVEGDTLDVDHIEQSSKTMDPTQVPGRGNPSHPKHGLLLKELEGCQLLCKQCHHRKSHMEQGRRPVAAHGTRACYRRGCRESSCVEAQRTYNRTHPRKNPERKRARDRERYRERRRTS